jgi:spore maturation protein SpmB
MARYFGAMAMLVFGVIVIALPALVVPAIGVGYLSFGAMEFVVSGYQPFMAIFMLPGALLLEASALGRRLPAAT